MPTPPSSRSRSSTLMEEEAKRVDEDVDGPPPRDVNLDHRPSRDAPSDANSNQFAGDDAMDDVSENWRGSRSEDLQRRSVGGADSQQRRHQQQQQQPQLPKRRGRLIYKLVLTGGPCAGKTTGQNRVSDFFENLGWKVFRVPETANILLGGGVKFAELDKRDSLLFQENLIKTMLAIENTYFTLAETCAKNCLVICDRGIMDATAFILADEWAALSKKNNWKTSNLRDKRYDQVIHLVSAANGAENFYTVDEHATRSESVELARFLDDRASNAWVGHPYFDVIDNSTSFDIKLIRAIDIICNRIGLNVGDRLTVESKKRKFLVAALPADSAFPEFQDFDVIHDYLSTPGRSDQARLRARGQRGDFAYTHTIRLHVRGDQERPELKKSITKRDYRILYAQRDPRRYSVYKTRRCFVWKHHYFQLDSYLEPCHPDCRGLILLETYTADDSPDLQHQLPPFLKILREVTGEPAFSMYNLCLMEEYRGIASQPGGADGAAAGASRSDGALDNNGRRRVKSENGVGGGAPHDKKKNNPPLGAVNGDPTTPIVGVATRKYRYFSGRSASRDASGASLREDADEEEDDRSRRNSTLDDDDDDDLEAETSFPNVDGDNFVDEGETPARCFHPSDALSGVGPGFSPRGSSTVAVMRRVTSRTAQQRSASLPPNAAADGAATNRNAGERINGNGGGSAEEGAD